MNLSGDTTFIVIITGLILIQLFSNYFLIWKKVTTGKSLFLNDDETKYGWGSVNSAFCFLGLFTLIPLVWLESSLPLGDIFVIAFFTGAIIFLVNCIVMGVLLSTMFSKKTQYMRDCLTLGFDIKDHIGKFVILCRKNTRYSQKNGTTKCYTVEVERIVSVETPLGLFAKTVFIEQIIDLPPSEVSKTTIQEVAKKYFKNRKDLRLTYLVESEEDLLIKEESSFEILTINMED